MLDETTEPFPTIFTDLYKELEDLGAPVINDYELEDLS